MRPDFNLHHRQHRQHHLCLEGSRRTQTRLANTGGHSLWSDLDRTVHRHRQQSTPPAAVLTLFWGFYTGSQYDQPDQHVTSYDGSPMPAAWPAWRSMCSNQEQFFISRWTATMDNRAVPCSISVSARTPRFPPWRSLRQRPERMSPARWWCKAQRAITWMSPRSIPIGECPRAPTPTRLPQF